MFACILLTGQTAFAHNYRQLFGRNYTAAERSVTSILPIIKGYANSMDEDAHLMQAIIFPELMRYDRLFDAVETGSLMGLYTRLGADYANFSIGKLQMKPTFALGLESFMITHRRSPWVKSLGFDNLKIADNYTDRLSRVNRLDDLEWQVRYLVAMLKCIRIKHQKVWDTFTEEEKVRFAATAYNYGWDRSSAAIKTYITKAYYHLKPWNSDVKYCFADVAFYRYKEIIVRS